MAGIGWLFGELKSYGYIDTKGKEISELIDILNELRKKDGKEPTGREQVGYRQNTKYEEIIKSHKEKIKKDIETGNYNNTYKESIKVNSILRSVEQKNFLSKYEIVTIIDKEGNVLLQKNGNHKNSVQFEKNEYHLLNNAILTHNHPGYDTVLSVDDVDMMILDNIFQIRATSMNNDIVILTDVGYKNNSAIDLLNDFDRKIKFFEYYEKIFTEANTIAYNKLDRNEATYADFKDRKRKYSQYYPSYNKVVREHLSEKLKNIEKEYGFAYEIKKGD
jgi:hypothetical protein